MTEEAVDISAELGAESASSQCFSIYVPDKDQDDKEIGNQRMWVLEALKLLGDINGGASAMPPLEGTWLNEEGQTICEHPVVVYSYVKSADRFTEELPRIREFLHRMGRETRQGEVAFEFDGCFHRIRQYDEA